MTDVRDGVDQDASSDPGEGWRQRRARARTIEDWSDDPWDDPEVTTVDLLEPLGRRRRLIPRLVAATVVIILIGVIVLGGVALWYIRRINPPGDPGPAQNFTVNDTDTLLTVSQRLEDEGFVVDDAVFRWYVERQGGIDLVPGFYTLRPLDHMGNIVRVLRTPPNETYSKVTFPEGFTLTQMARRLAETMPGISAKRFVQLATSGDITSDYQQPGGTSLEGLLFPDTYFIAGDETEAQVIQRMADMMERVGRQEGFDSLSGETLTPYQILVVASLIEREARVPSERAKIARVIYNRLYIGMPLQIDASLYYGQDPDTPFSELKESDSPYNLYRVTGLPPTPIANPGRASIEAAMNPAPNPSPNDPLCAGLGPGESCVWLYYVLADEDGNHAFSVTLAQHEANVQAARDKGLL